MAPGDLLGRALEEDGVLPEGAVWRSSGSSRTVCVFGVTESAAQDRVVEGALAALRRRGRMGRVTIEFWSGDPPPRGVQISNKPPAPRVGEPPPDVAAELNAPLAIGLLRTVEIPAAENHRIVAPRVRDQRAAVVTDVRACGAVPPRGSVTWNKSTLLIYGVEDTAAQDAIIAVAREAQARLAPRAMEEVFEQMVFKRFDATYAPNGRMSVDEVVLRTVTLD